jgi:hypothetical protein
MSIDAAGEGRQTCWPVPGQHASDGYADEKTSTRRGGVKKKRHVMSPCGRVDVRRVIVQDTYYKAR